MMRGTVKIEECEINHLWVGCHFIPLHHWMNFPNTTKGITLDFIFFQSLKHHLPAIVENIVTKAQRGEKVDQFMEDLYPIGRGGVTDVYQGPLSVSEIIGEVHTFLEERNAVDVESFSRFLESVGDIKRRGHYHTVELSDQSQFVLRLIDEDPDYFVHLHPARYSPQTFRTKPNTLKSAIFTNYLGRCRQVDPLDLEVINTARTFLELSVVPEVPSAMGELIEVFSREIETFLHTSQGGP